MSRTVDALQGALAAEHAAVYGYGTVGARLDGGDRETARIVMNAHRARRDELAAYISARGARPVAAAAAYRLPVRVASPQTAAQLAAVLEDRALGAYLGLAGVDEPELRRYAALAMQEAAGRAVAWRRAAGGSSTVGAFPGLPPDALYPRR
ncbi:ferritin-like domain-containing protein [Thermomonospora amylolytica]|uniref:ferritin-like domain-containing protein n=1 Tax=Thermomonospora amylolytica TaxID=1411117 RepID=UPI000E6C9522|nr:ferritin-like domain-containing protein [Thermomonospora amylolytica]